MLKSGIKTTEFWGKAVATVMGLLVGTGILQPETGHIVTEAAGAALPIVQSIIDGVVQLTGLVGSFILQFRYGKDRTALKTNAG
jgi:hypothetical protein